MHKNSKNMNLKEHYKYGIVRKDNTVILFDDTTQYGNIKEDSYLTDVRVKLKDGLLYVSGMEYEGHYAYDRIPIEKLESRPRQSDIKHRKGCKWLGIKPMDYVYGWFFYPSKNEVTHILKDFKIKIML